jgi:DNA-directed RNA polymerase subunit RPC12/RpoP
MDEKESKTESVACKHCGARTSPRNRYALYWCSRACWQHWYVNIHAGDRVLAALA